MINCSTLTLLLQSPRIHSHNFELDTSENTHSSITFSSQLNSTQHTHVSTRQHRLYHHHHHQQQAESAGEGRAPGWAEGAPTSPWRKPGELTTFMISICRCSSSRIRRFSSSEMLAAAALLADDRLLIAVATLAGLQCPYRRYCGYRGRV